MIEKYNEVTAFFQRDKFTQKELTELITNCKTNPIYSNKDHARIKAQIDLELLRYKLALLEPQSAKRTQNSSFKKSKKKLKIYPNTKIKIKAHYLENEFQTNVKYAIPYIGKTFQEINTELGWPSGRLERLANQRGLNVISSSKLNTPEFQIISEIIANRIALLNGKKPVNETYISKKLKKKITTTNKTSLSSVYEKIQLTGGVGKLIYIRMRF